MSSIYDERALRVVEFHSEQLPGHEPLPVESINQSLVDESGLTSEATSATPAVSKRGHSKRGHAGRVHTAAHRIEDSCCDESPAIRVVVGVAAHLVCRVQRAPQR